MLQTRIRLVIHLETRNQAWRFKLGRKTPTHKLNLKSFYCETARVLCISQRFSLTFA